MSIRRRWPDVEAENAETDAEVLADEMERRRNANDWREFHWADATRTAQAFFENGLWRESRYRHLMGFLILQIGPGAQPAYVRAMFRKYLELFDPNDAALTPSLARTFKQQWHECGLRADRLVRHFGIFEPDRNLASRIAIWMDGQDAPYSALRGLGMEAPHGPGLMEFVHRRFVGLLSPRIKSGQVEAAKKLLDWLHPEHEGPLEKGAEDAINALLLPWCNDDPNEEFKNFVQRRLVSAYRDLRVNQAWPWSLCAREALEVMRRWLTGSTIRVFFDIVTRADDSHMWPERRRFWVGLYEGGQITEAWFALSPQGEFIASNLHKGREGSSLEFARNSSWGAQDRRKCLLIMNVNGCWVVEGSHSFPVWVFPRAGRSMLTLYEKSYSCDHIRNMSGPYRPKRIVHIGDWESKVLRALLQ